MREKIGTKVIYRCDFKGCRNYVENNLEEGWCECETCSWLTFCPNHNLKACPNGLNHLLWMELGKRGKEEFIDRLKGGGSIPLGDIE